MHACGRTSLHACPLSLCVVIVVIVVAAIVVVSFIYMEIVLLSYVLARDNCREAVDQEVEYSTSQLSKKNYRLIKLET